jgi:hypothetical protein
LIERRGRPPDKRKAEPASPAKATIPLKGI